MRPSNIARRWIEAISTRDRQALLAVSHQAIEIHGPQGVGIGHDVMSAWFDISPMQISINSLAERGQDVLIEHHIDWFGEDSQVESSIDNTAMIEVREGKVFSYRRVADPEALTPDFVPIVQ